MPGPLPFEPPIGWHQTSTCAEGSAERRRGVDGLRPGVDQPRSSPEILRPGRHQSPAERGQGAASVRIRTGTRRSPARARRCSKGADAVAALIWAVGRVRGPSDLACPRTPRAALAEGTIERRRKPTDGDTDGGLTSWVARDGLVSFVPQVVPLPPVEHLGLCDRARGRRRESSILGDCSASPRTPVPPAVLRNTGAHGRLARMAGAWRQTRTVRCMVRVIHGFSRCHRVAPASMSRRI